MKKLMSYNFPVASALKRYVEETTPVTKALQAAVKKSPYGSADRNAAERAFQMHKADVGSHFFVSVLIAALNPSTLSGLTDRERMGLGWAAYEVAQNALGFTDPTQSAKETASGLTWRVSTATLTTVTRAAIGIADAI